MKRADYETDAKYKLNEIYRILIYIYLIFKRNLWACKWTFTLNTRIIYFQHQKGNLVEFPVVGELYRNTLYFHWIIIMDCGCYS